MLKGPGRPVIGQTGSRRAVPKVRGQTDQRRPVTKGPTQSAIGRTGSSSAVPKGRCTRLTHEDKY